MDNLYLEAKEVAASYGKFKVSGVNFVLKSGDILGLVGRSGAGKSTVLEVLTGLKRPNAGNLCAYVNNRKGELKELIGYSPQNNSLYPYLTLYENLITFGRLYKVPRLEIDERIKFLAKRFDLENCMHKKIVQLSGGMQKRADLAVTLVHDPKIIILDEPFNGLDISLQRFIWSLLRELGQQGKIIIISSHMLNDIQKNCNQFGLIERGQFFGTQQVMKAIRQSNEKNLELFLELLFTKDLNEDR